MYQEHVINYQRKLQTVLPAETHYDHQGYQSLAGVWKVLCALLSLNSLVLYHNVHVTFTCAVQNLLEIALVELGCVNVGYATVLQGSSAGRPTPNCRETYRNL